jgi:hypothetical protein
MPEINGLYPTPTRKALLRLIAAGHGRIYGEAKQVWDKQTYTRVTAKVKEFIAHDWVRALTPDEARGPGETASLRTYYRLTEYGRTAMRSEG